MIENTRFNYQTADLPRGGIERTGLAARKRGDHAEIYSNVGQAYRAIHNWR